MDAATCNDCCRVWQALKQVEGRSTGRPPRFGWRGCEIGCFFPGETNRSLASSPTTTMSRTVLNRRRRHLLTSFLLAMLLFRAYVPVGFMRASGPPFLVEICPADTALH